MRRIGRRSDQYPMHYLYFLVAIVAEVVATSSLKASERFTRPLPSLMVIVGYVLAFILLSLVVEKMPVGVVYAIWSGAGIILVAVVGAVWLKQRNRPVCPGLWS